MAQYKVGTVDVVNGSQTVTGTGTAWNTSSNVEVGDIFTVDQGVTWYEVGSVDSDTQITLTANFAGTTQNGISYAITRDFTNNFDLPYPNNQDIGTAGILRRALEEVDSVIGGGNGDLSFNDLTVNGLINLINSGAIQDASTDAITFDGSQNVDIPNGKLTASGGLETNSGSFQNHITQIVADDSNTTIQLWRDSGGNNIGRLILRNLDGVGAGDVFIDGENSLALSVTGTDTITCDTSSNVDIPNGTLSEQGVRVGPIESGTWTPVLEGSSTPGTQTYATQSARYERRGNLVTVDFNIRLSNLDGATSGNVIIEGLPFTVLNNSEYSGAGEIYFIANWTPPGDYAGGLILRAEPNGTFLALRYFATSGGAFTVTASDLSNSYFLQGSATYVIN